MLYHVTWRGDWRGPIFKDDHDRPFQSRFKAVLVDEGAYYWRSAATWTSTRSGRGWRSGLGIVAGPEYEVDERVTL